MGIFFIKKIKMKAVYILSLVLLFATVLAYKVTDSDETVYAKDGDGNIVIVIDPGHGGYDSGATSASTGDKESDLNWNIAKYMKAELETYEGVRVYVTRANNEWNSNTGRAQLGRALGADAIISIHNNSASSESANGFVAYGSVSQDFVEVTKNLCLNMARYASAAGLNLYNNGYLTRTSSNDSSVDYYTVIDEGIKAGIPTIIVEHCFLSNSSNAAFMHETANQKKVGVADATAVAEFFGLSKRTISDGQSVVLDRSYSAYFIPANQRDGAITFTTSDENVAHVRSDGLITAVNAGTATITYTYQDGTSGSCTFTTKEVTQVGVAAGINPTVYHTSEQVAAIDKSKIMVKAIYSDGTCRQQSSGYVIGDIDPNMAGRQYISVSHNGFSSTFSITLDASKDAGNYQEYLYQVHGDYSDIFTLPELVAVEGVTGSPYTSNGFEDRPVSGDTTTQTEQETESPIQEETSSFAEENTTTETSEEASSPAEENTTTASPEETAS
ncbi:MAG: N-acetylmuramoyl-L-alanine amidase, partial [Lachnospiraceae bacterium]